MKPVLMSRPISSQLPKDVNLGIFPLLFHPTPSGLFPSTHNMFILKQTRKQTNQHISLNTLPLTSFQPISLLPWENVLKGSVNTRSCQLLSSFFYRNCSVSQFSSYDQFLTDRVIFPTSRTLLQVSSHLAGGSSVSFANLSCVLTNLWWKVSSPPLYTHSCSSHPVMWLKIHLHTEDAQIFSSNLDFSPILVQTPKCLLLIYVLGYWRDTFNSPCPKQRYWYSQTYFIQSLFYIKIFTESLASQLLKPKF